MDIMAIMNIKIIMAIMTIIINIMYAVNNIHYNQHF